MSWNKLETPTISNSNIGDSLGYSVSLSSDGTTLAIGAPVASSYRGQVSISKRNVDDNIWSPPVIIATGSNNNDQLGISVSLSSDGNTLAIGAIGVSTFKGQVSISKRNVDGNTWSLPVIIATGLTDYSRFGNSVSLSSDGTTLAIGAIGVSTFKGQVSISKRNVDGNTWSLPVIIATGLTDYSRFGNSVSLSSDGTTLAIGQCNIYGVMGSVSVCKYNAGDNTWSSPVNIASGSNGFGFAVSLSSDGTTLAIGRPYTLEGQVSISKRNVDNNTWSTPVIIANDSIEDRFGFAVSLSSDGTTLAVGAYNEFVNMGKVAIYKYIPASTIESISPVLGPLRGRSVTISGTNLSGATSVTFGGVAATILSTSLNSITCITPSGPAGPVNVTVTSPGGTVTKPNAFTYVSPPTITSVSPDKSNILEPTVLTINGTNFIQGNTRVSIGRMYATNIVVNNSGKITCTTPIQQRSGYVRIDVTTPGGSYTSSDTYYLYGTDTLGTISAKMTFGNVNYNSAVGSAITNNLYFIYYLATLLNVNSSQITITSVTQGSIIVNYTIAGVTQQEQTILNNMNLSDIDTSSIINYISQITGVSPSNITINSTVEGFTPNTIISNICFPAGTPIKCNQGNIPIEKLNPEIHTINGKKIVGITKTVTQDSYLVCFEKDALQKNIPNKNTIISQNHKIFYKGKFVKANDFISNFKNVKSVKYSGEVLYNVLMEQPDVMIVNNLICETLHPENIVAKLYKAIKNLSIEEQYKFLSRFNKYVIKNSVYNKQYKSMQINMLN